MAPSKSTRPSSTSRPKPTSGGSKASSGLGVARASAKSPARPAFSAQRVGGASFKVGGRHSAGLGGLPSFGGGRRSSGGGYADLRRTSLGSTYTPAPRQSAFGLGSVGGRATSLGANSSVYKRRRSILDQFSDEELSEDYSDEDDARSLSAQFEDNNAFDEVSSGLEEDFEDGWMSDRDHSTRTSARVADKKLRQSRQAGIAQLEKLAQSALVNGPAREVELLDQAYRNTVAQSDELFNGLLNNDITQGMIEVARQIEARRKEASQAFISQYKDLKKTVAINQKQASEALEAGKEVYAQLADERERADHDLDTARKRMEASLKRIRAEADANNKKVVQELTANGKQTQKKGKH